MQRILPEDTWQAHVVSVTLALWSLSFLICKKGLQQQFHLGVVEIKFEKAGEHSKQRGK